MGILYKHLFFALCSKQVHSLGEPIVSRQYRCGRAKEGLYRSNAVPHIAIVGNIVVQQGGGVQKFRHGRCAIAALVERCSAEACGKQREQWPQLFALCVQKVEIDLLQKLALSI